MVPPQPPLAATGSEIDLFRLLERIDLGDHAVAFTSLNLSNHEYKKWGEIDFVVLAPEGLLAIEIKGGQVHCDHRGLWRYESRGKQPIERAESPMAQVSSAYFSLRDRHLAPSLGRALVNAAPSGFGVILAKTSTRDANARGIIGGTEMPADLVATREEVETVPALAETLSRFLAHWRGKKSFRKWTPEEVTQIATAMRPWFDRVVPLSLSAARVREEQLSLTVEQYCVLDFSDQEDRVLCTGGAGCGKTLLAVECLRREMHSNPLLVTGTDSLALHLRSSHVADTTRVMSFAELASRPIDKCASYDCLIVDEGQQITNPAALNVLSDSLAGGLEQGRWRWFSDPNNQLAKTSNFDVDSQRRLESLAFNGSLSRNCRSTPQIMQTVRVVTGARVGKDSAKGHGPEVIFPVSTERSAQLQAAADTIGEWLKDREIAPGEIVLLSAREIPASSIPEIARLTGLGYRAWQSGWSKSASYRTHLAASTIENFRGIEAPFVVLCDIDATTEDPVCHLYLGMTRPNFGLFVMADHEVIAGAVAQSSLKQSST
jgi:hypothetical protein